MKKLLRLSWLLLLPLAFSSCRSAYMANNFYNRTVMHKTVAVLPVQMVYTGKMPKGMTPAMLKEEQEAESRAFQISLMNAILSKSHKKGGYTINFQDVEKTNNLLRQHNISPTQAWAMNPEQISKILGVEAVVAAKIEKKRFISDLASYGINLGTNILDVILADAGNLLPAGVTEAIGNAAPGSATGSVVPALPDDLSKTNEIRAHCSVLDSRDGAVLWRVSATAETDYEFQPSQAIEQINYKFARNFPYRRKKG
ncbi:hypothetical protein I5M27_14345 [Adhaeribacter sp. BT258]|uniref:Lipoprotein n=1 Tax=Adhaeribacter terrigena TaxID=2793070 RepID=A0ABS1C438_9BACT|nr:hypothetical protein [Adhaeribacter terrigena]MBK0404172.1 hypothetical protein [Adhaeribacter terrigena]